MSLIFACACCVFTDTGFPKSIQYNIAPGKASLFLLCPYGKGKVIQYCEIYSA